MQALRTLADRLISLSATLGSLGLVVVLGTVLVDVTGRALGHPLYGSQDIITMAATVLVFGGMAICDRAGGHVTVDIFERSFPAWLNRAGDIAAALLGAVVFAFIAYAVFASARLSVMLNLNTNLLGLPKAWFQWGIVAFSVLTALGMALRAAELIVLGRNVHRDGSFRG